MQDHITFTSKQSSAFAESNRSFSECYFYVNDGHYTAKVKAGKTFSLFLPSKCPNTGKTIQFNFATSIGCVEYLLTMSADSFFATNVRYKPTKVET